MTLRPYLARKEKLPQGWGAMGDGADCAWVIFCVERCWCFTRRYLVIASMAAVLRWEVVGGCGTEEPARYRVAVARLRKGRDRDKRSAFLKDGGDEVTEIPKL